MKRKTRQIIETEEPAMIPFEPWFNKKMKDPAFKKAYDDLDFEFAVILALMEARQKDGLTQKQLAEKIGTTQSAIARFESGTANPTLSFLKKVATAFDLKLTVTR
jgi:ribosome-binding protein aMBF1 (putative translation factor)